LFVSRNGYSNTNVHLESCPVIGYKVFSHRNGHNLTNSSASHDGVSQSWFWCSSIGRSSTKLSISTGCSPYPFIISSRPFLSGSNNTSNYSVSSVGLTTKGEYNIERSVKVLTSSPSTESEFPVNSKGIARLVSGFTSNNRFDGFDCEGSSRVSNDNYAIKNGVTIDSWTFISGGSSIPSRKSNWSMNTSSS